MPSSTAMALAEGLYKLSKGQVNSGLSFWLGLGFARLALRDTDPGSGKGETAC